MQVAGLGSYRDNFRKILHLDDNPIRSRRFAIGVSSASRLSGFIWHWPSPSLSSRLNKGTAVAVLVVLPWFIPLVLSLSYILGRFMLGQDWSSAVPPSSEMDPPGASCPCCSDAASQAQRLTLIFSCGRPSKCGGGKASAGHFDLRRK
jgi:hypothetical protein